MVTKGYICIAGGKITATVNKIITSLFLKIQCSAGLFSLSSLCHSGSSVSFTFANPLDIGVLLLLSFTRQFSFCQHLLASCVVFMQCRYACLQIKHLAYFYMEAKAATFSHFYGTFSFLKMVVYSCFSCEYMKNFTCISFMCKRNRSTG